MWNSVTSIIFICISLGNAQFIPEMVCYRLDHTYPNIDLDFPNQLTPNTFLNMVEQFTPMENIVLEKAGERIIRNEKLTISEYFRLGVFRKSNYFYIVIAVFYLYWLFYDLIFFKISRKEFDEMTQSFRAFHAKNAVIILYAFVILLAVYNIFYTLKWVQYYSNANDNRENKTEAFMSDYQAAIDYTSSRSTCYIEEMATELDEIEAFHKRIQRYHYENIPQTEDVMKIISGVAKIFKEECNNTSEECGPDLRKQKMANFSVIAIFQNDVIKPKFEMIPNWNNFPITFENITRRYLVGWKPNYSNVRQASSDRLMLLKDVYSRIENLFVMPNSLIVAILFYFLFGCVLIIVLVSVCSLLAMLRDHDYLQNNGIATHIVTYLTKFNYFIVAVSCFALVWSWIVILFSSSAHSLYLNVLRDSKMEVLGKLNVTDSNGTAYFNFREFLNSTDETTIEEALALNPQEILKKDETLQNHFSEWKKEMSEKLNKNESLYSPIKELCEAITLIFDLNQGEWISQRRRDLEEIIKLCKITENDCFFCEFKTDLIRTEKAAQHIRQLSFTVANRSGDDLEVFRLLHEKYRLQMWNDYVAPITFLEVPSLIILITLYVMSFMMMATISIVESDYENESYEDLRHYYDVHTADRGLYWFNM